MRPRGTAPVAAALAALGALFILLPGIGLLARTPWRDLPERLASGVVADAARISLVVATGAAGLAALLGLPLAWVLARVPFPGRALLRSLVLLPLVLPPVVAGIGLLAAFGRRGILGRPLATLGVELPFTTAAAVLAAAFVAFPLFVLAVEAGIRSLDARLEDAAATMGASRWYALRRVVLPLLRPSLSSGLALAWARALGEFGATIMFAGNLRGRTQTLPLAAFEVAQTDPGGGVAIALVLVGISVAVLVVLRGRLFR
ncbi:MAG TPA: molybdate ABC transporter permease subunit [Actinomycetota bacterium]|nr:molybdate ABC transporter permease subunit [Actinomycetota bacterium]